MKLLEKGKFIGAVFVYGAKSQLEQEWIWAAAAVVGLNQGLKYKGNLKAGVTGGLAVLGTLALVNGFYNIIVHWDKIQNVLNHKED